MNTVHISRSECRTKSQRKAR